MGVYRYLFSLLFGILVVGGLLTQFSYSYQMLLPAMNYDTLSLPVSNKVVQSVSSNEVKRVVKSTVAIRIYTPEGKDIVIGSGVLLRDKRIGLIVLTARHVSLTILEKSPRACSILSSSCVELDASFVVTVSPDMRPSSDWAVYKLPRLPEGAATAQISNSRVSIGDFVWVSGVPWGRIPWISSGNIAWQWTDDGELLMGISGYAAPGSSGGGVFNKEGKLIGITVAIMRTYGGIQTSQVLVVPIENIWVLNK